MNRPACVTGPLENRKLVLEWKDLSTTAEPTKIVRSDVNIGLTTVLLYHGVTSGKARLCFSYSDDDNSIDIESRNPHEAKLLSEEYLWKQASAICEMFEGR